MWKWGTPVAVTGLEEFCPEEPGFTTVTLFAELCPFDEVEEFDPRLELYSILSEPQFCYFLSF